MFTTTISLIFFLKSVRVFTLAHHYYSLMSTQSIISVVQIYIHVFVNVALNSRPCMHLPGPPKATLAVRCCPTLFKLREIPRKTPLGDHVDI